MRGWEVWASGDVEDKGLAFSREKGLGWRRTFALDDDGVRDGGAGDDAARGGARARDGRGAAEPEAAGQPAEEGSGARGESGGGSAIEAATGVRGDGAGAGWTEGTRVPAARGGENARGAHLRADMAMVCAGGRCVRASSANDSARPGHFYRARATWPRAVHGAFVDGARRASAWFSYWRALLVVHCLVGSRARNAGGRYSLRCSRSAPWL